MSGRPDLRLVADPDVPHDDVLPVQDCDVERPERRPATYRYGFAADARDDVDGAATGREAAA